MGLSSVNKYYASNSQDAIDHFKDCLVSAGWTLHDDLSGSSPYGYVLLTDGEDSDQMNCYIQLYENGEDISMVLWSYWDNTTHAGAIKTGNPPYMKIDADSDGPFYIWCSANKSSAIFISYIGTEYDFIAVCELLPLVNDCNGLLQSVVSSGSNVVLQLASGEASGFIKGKSYQIIDENSRDYVEVNAVDATNDQLTITTLTYNYTTNARIGTLPHRWMIFSSEYDNAYGFPMYPTGTADNLSYPASINRSLFFYNNTNPCMHCHQKYVFWPSLFNEYSTEKGVIGFQKANATYFKCYVGATSEHTISIGDIDEGTSSGSNTTTTVNDTSKAWTTNDFTDKIIIITGGTGAGQFNTIASNTSTEITVSNVWTTTPDNTSTYTICDEGWLYFYFNNSTEEAGAIRII